MVKAFIVSKQHIVDFWQLCKLARGFAYGFCWFRKDYLISWTAKAQMALSARVCNHADPINLGMEVDNADVPIWCIDTMLQVLRVGLIS